MDDQRDPSERDREDEDLELDADQAEDVKGGATMPVKTQSTAYSNTVGGGKLGTSTTPAHESVNLNPGTPPSPPSAG